MGKEKKNFAELCGVEIFQAGKYPQGDYPRETLEKIAAGYDPTYHEAPSFIDHEGSDGQRSAKGAACGWIDKLYLRGEKLLADIKQVPDAFVELLKAGRLKKRSVEIYPDLAGKGPYLRALAWLGADVPQVKGLADVTFRDKEPEHKTVEYDGPLHPRIRKFADKKKHMEKMDMPYMSLDEAPGNMREMDGVMMTLEQVNQMAAMYDAIKAEGGADNPMAVAKAKFREMHKIEDGKWVKLSENSKDEDMAIQFAEMQTTIKTLTDALKQTQADLATVKTGQAQATINQRKASVTAFCEQMVREFRMTPAERAIEEPVLLKLVGVDVFSEADEKIVNQKRAYYLNRPPMPAGEFAKNADGTPKAAIQGDKEAAIAKFNEKREEFIAAGVKPGALIFGELYEKGYSRDEITAALTPDERKQANIQAN